MNSLQNTVMETPGEILNGGHRQHLQEGGRNSTSETFKQNTPEF